MQGIYEPKGAAREYADLAVNLYRGCSHGCVYCYAPGITHQTRKDFINPKPRDGIIEQINKDLRRLNVPEQNTTPIFLCFTCDPYQPIDAEYEVTRQSILTIHRYGFPVRILTKGGMLAQRDFDLLGPQDEFGVTLTCLHDRDCAAWEPNAARTGYRIDNLKEAHRRGIRTWVSFEPVLNHDETLVLIEDVAPVSDRIMVGRWNHDVRANVINWNKFGYEAEVLLQSLGKSYYIKAALRKEMHTK